MNNPINSSDTRQRFLFDHSDVRGEITSLQSSFQQITSHQNYPPAVTALFGEFLAAASLLSATLKFPGIVSIQAVGRGPVKTIMAECYQKTKLRGIVRGELDALTGPETLSTMLGSATLAITIEPEGGERYQGIVPMEQDSLSGCLEHYFAQSEQLPTKIKLAADTENAAGVLIQQIPGSEDKELAQSQWQHLGTLFDSLKTEEQLTLSHGDQLYRLFHGEDLRLLDKQPLQFLCSCSKSRTATALVSLGRSEVESLCEQRGSIQITCEFCGQRYEFDQPELDTLFDGGQLPTH